MTVKLTLNNKTAWTRRSLRKLVMAGLKEYALETNYYRVDVVPAGQRRTCSGYAYYNTGYVCVRIPHPRFVQGEDGLRYITDQFARVFEHEVMHNLGMSHPDMTKEGYRCRSGDAPTWAAGILLEPKKTKVKPTRQDRVNQREANAGAMVKRWERKLKLARTKLRYWQSKVRYYDRKKAATGPSPEAGNE